MIEQKIVALDDAQFEALQNKVVDLYITLAEESLIETDEDSYNRLRALYEQDGFKNIGLMFKSVSESDEIPASLMEYKDSLAVAQVFLMTDDLDEEYSKLVANIVFSIDDSTTETSVAWFPED